jgi:hypothetical protein
VEKDERQVVPVLRLASLACCCGLCDDEPSEPGHVDLNRAPEVTDPATELSRGHVPGGESGAAQVDRTKRVAFIEDENVAALGVVLVRQELELHDHGRLIAVVRCPAPHPAGLRLKLGVPQRILELPPVHHSASDFEVDLHVDVGRSGVSVLAGFA